MLGMSGASAETAVTLLKYRTDAPDGTPCYDSYALSGVVVRERFTLEREAVEVGETVLYFLYDRSVCRSADGAVVPLPRMSSGDLCVLRFGEADEERLRIAEVGYFNGGALSHVRMKLK